MILTLFAFTSSDTDALKQGQGMEAILWVLLLFSSLLSQPGMLARDDAEGMLDQWRILPLALEWVLCIKWLIAWAVLALPLLIFAPLALAMLHIEDIKTANLIGAFGLASATITALLLFVSALAVRLNGVGWLSILIVPLMIPVLLFGQAVLSSNTAHIQDAWLLLLGSSFFMIPVALIGSTYIVRYE